MLLWVLDPAGEVVDEDELNEGGVDEEHADPVPEVHGGQVGHHGQVGAESVGGGEEVEHGGDAQHHAGRHRVPLDPEGDEGGGDQDYAFITLVICMCAGDTTLPGMKTVVQ